MKNKNLFASIFFCLIFFGCQNKKDFENEALYEREDDYRKIEWIFGDFWKGFKDERLNALIEEALIENPTLKIAKERVALARFKTLEAKASLFPLLNFDGDTTKYVQSKTGIFAPPEDPNQSIFPLRYTQTELLLDFEYEFDFFEKNKNLLRSSISDLETKKMEATASRMILSLSMAEVYFKLQTDLLRNQISNEIKMCDSKQLELKKSRLKNGLSTSILIETQEIELLDSRQKLSNDEEAVRLDKNLIESLLGSKLEISLNDFETSFDELESKYQAYFENFSNDLPLDLIHYRVDIQAILNTIRSFGFQVKAAEALFYPNFNLVALTGLQTIQLSKLFNGDSFYGVFGPAVHLPLFDGGYLNANLGQKKVEYTIATEKYQERVLLAIRQVLDAKVFIDSLEEQFQEQSSGVLKFKNIWNLIEMKVKNNLASSDELIEAKKNYLKAKSRLIDLQFLKIRAILNLTRALGGGYE